MLASMLIPTLLLLASAAVAQEETPSVVTSIAISPSPTTEEIFTIQTSDPWSCYEDCIQAPCPPCSTGSMMSVPPVSESVVSVITNPLLSTVTGIMSIPPLETPLSTGVMSIPAGETPLSTDSLETVSTSITTNSPSSNLSMTGTGSSPAEQTTNAAAVAKGNAMPLVVGIAGAMALF